MVSNFPPWVLDRAFPDFHDAVTSLETCLAGGIDKFDVGPLIAVMMNVISDLAE